MRTILIAFILLLSTACALKIPPSQSIAPSKSDAAIIITTGDRGFKMLSITPSISTSIYLIDGGSVKPSSGKNEYWVKPGNREIDARCRMSMGSKKLSGKDKISVKLEKGVQYQLSASLVTQLMKSSGSKTTCKPVIEELKH